MKNEIFFENGIHTELSSDEMKLLWLLLKYHGRDITDKYDIDIKALEHLKIIFFEHLD